MNKHKKSLLMAALLACAGFATAQVLWEGDVDANWSTDSAGNTNWAGDVIPGAADTAQFNNLGADRGTVVDASFGGTIAQLNINNSTTTVTETISLARSLTLANNNGLQYGSTISNPEMFELDLNGNSLILGFNASSGVVYNLHGTYTMDTAGSTINSVRSQGTGDDDTVTLNFGSGSNLADINVTANGTISHDFNNGTANANKLTSINFGAGSTVDISNASTLTLLKRLRVDTGTINFEVNNSGTINVAAASKLYVQFDNRKGDDNRLTHVNNLATGVINLTGDLQLEPDERGFTVIQNAGTFQVTGTGATITGKPNSTSSGDLGDVAFTNQSGGIIRGSSAADTLNYNPTATAANINQTLTLTNQGILSPGDGHNGTGLASVGTLSLTDINATFSGTDATLRIDLGGLSGGEFDVLTLTNGQLTLDGDSKIELFYVNGFSAVENDSWTLLNYGSVVNTGFDLASALTVTGGSGLAGDASNYSLTFDANSATLTVIPEPGTLALVGIALASLLFFRRRKA
ncbi:MAG: PEP-CTERM sorting domain-containing protein [Opitutales bacterium]